MTPKRTGSDAAPRVGIIMGSDSDLPVMQPAADVLAELGIAYEMTIVSAHRTPARLYDYARTAVERGLRVIVAGAGGAAHLPGMAAAITPLPVIGVPVKTSSLSGQDSLLSIVQMPAGVPVATVAINGAKNAGLLAAQILGAADPEILERVAAFKHDLEAQVLDKVERMAAGEITAESVSRSRAAPAKS
jgi:5-(carboxyamino)imidazole ribonucleotide mutase